MIKSVETYHEFLEEASAASSARALRARNPVNKTVARSLAAVFSTAAESQVSYDGTYRVAVPLDAIIYLAEVATGRSAPQVQKSA